MGNYAMIVYDLNADGQLLHINSIITIIQRVMCLCAYLLSKSRSSARAVTMLWTHPLFVEDNPKIQRFSVSGSIVS